MHQADEVMTDAIVPAFGGEKRENMAEGPKTAPSISTISTDHLV
jgi:hypothetical protein